MNAVPSFLEGPNFSAFEEFKTVVENDARAAGRILARVILVRNEGLKFVESDGWAQPDVYRYRFNRWTVIYLARGPYVGATDVAVAQILHPNNNISRRQVLSEISRRRNIAGA